METRRNRFERDTKNPPPMASDPTPRDVRMIASVDRNKLLNSKQISALFAASPSNRKRILNRLCKLHHHGYLERRRGMANDPIVYGLGLRGSRYLGERPGFTRARAAQAERTRKITRHYEAHALGISEFMVAQELSCRARRSTRVIHPEEFLQRAKRKRLAWPVPVPHQGRVEEHWLIPDRLYGLLHTAAGQGSRRFYCLEIDRGTMPVVRSNPNQTSYIRKLLAYSYTHAQDLLYKNYGIERFQVLTFTTSKERIRNMIDAYREHIPRQLRRPNIFLFAESSAIELDTVVFGIEWQNAAGKPARLTV